MLTDDEAVKLRGSVLDLSSRQDNLDDFEKQAFGVAQKQLLDYESNAIAQKRLPYQQTPKVTLDNLSKFEESLNGDTSLYGEDLDDPETVTDTIGLSYMSSKFKKTVEEVSGNFEGYKKGLMDFHKTENFDSALRKDIEVTRDKINLINEAYDHAYRKAVNSDSLVESFSDFAGGREEIPQELVDFYDRAFKDAQIAYEENKEDFDVLLNSMRSTLEDVEVVGQPNFLNTVGALSKIDPKMRQLAFTYLDENLEADGSIKKAFEGRAGQIFRQLANVTPQEMLMQAQSTMAAIESGQSIAIFDSAMDPAIGETAQAALRVGTQTGAGILAPLPLWRTATPEEAAARYQDAKVAAQFGRALLDIESYVAGTLGKEEGFESETLNKLTEKIVYPATRMAPDMLLFIGAATTGKAMGSKAGRVFGTSPKMTGEIASTALSLKAMGSSLKSEHFNKMVLSNPEIDEAAAYEISNISGNTAAVLEGISMNFVLSRLPAVGNLMKSWKAGSFRSPTLAFLGTTAGSVGAETTTELAQDYTSDLTQQIFASFDESIPEVNLAEAFTDTIKQAPDIALAVLPYALIGGGNSAYLTIDSKKALLANTEALEAMGVTEKQIEEVMEQETLEDQVEKAESILGSIDLNAKAVELAQEGKDVSSFMGESDAALLSGVSESSTERLEPVISPIKDEKGEIVEYTVATPEGTEETFSTNKEAIQRAGQWYEENGVEGLIMPEDQGGKNVAREQNLNEQPITENSYAQENDVEQSVSFQEMPMPNAGKRILATKDVPAGIDKDAPVNTVQIMDGLSDLMRSVGLGGAIRTGKIRGRNKKSTLGQFWVREQIIRVRTANDFETGAHEAGHAIEDGIFGPTFRWRDSKDITKTAKDELVRLGKAIYQKEPHNGWDSEGFAEFFRLYITDPDLAMNKAPAFKSYFDKLVKTIPGLERKITQTQDLATTFMKQGSFQRVSSAIAPLPSRASVAKEKAIQGASDFEKNFIESAVAVRRFVEEANRRRAAAGQDPVAQDADPMFTLTARRLTADSVVKYMVEQGMLNYAGQRIGRPLTDVFKLVEGKTDEFIVYLYAKRAEALYNEGKNRNPGITQEDTQQVLEELQSLQFQKASQFWYDWNNGVLDYAVESSPDYAAAVEKIRDVDPGFYMPLQREFDAVTERYLSKGGGIKGKDLVKRLKGSGRRIKDPVESAIAQAKQIVQKSNQKAILDQITKIAETTPGLGHLIVEVPRPMVPSLSRDVSTVLEDVTKKIEEAGGTLEADIPDSVDLGEEFMTFFAPAVIPQNKDENPIMPIFKDGKLRWFEMDRDLYEAFNGMDMMKLSPALDLFLGVPARTFRLGTTGLNAGFSLVTNPIRDFRTLQLNSQASDNTGQLFVSWLSTIKDLFLNVVSNGKIENEWIDLFDRLGVRMAQPLGQDTRPLERAARRAKSGGKFTLFDSADYLREIFGFTEAAARLTEMKAVAKDIGYDIKQPITAREAAILANAGKNVTTDFTQAGKIARQVNQAVPFFNAAIQGPVSHAKALRRNPRKFMMRGLIGTGIALANWYRNKDEEWWKEMPLDERYAFSYMMVGGELVRIPRAFEADGLFMAGAEALADAWYQENPEEAGEWFAKWLGGFVPSALPVIPKLAAEQLANKNFFFDSPIVPRSQQDLFEEEQFSPYTLSVAIELGDIFNVSPRRIEHGIRSLFGGVAVDVLSILGRGDGDLVEKEFEPSDIPALGRLFQRGGQEARNPESVDKLYESYGEALRIQRSKKVEESEDQRAQRLLIMDAVRAVSVMNDVKNQTKSREKRQQIEKAVIDISKKAVNKTATRAELKKIKKEFKQQKAEK